MSQSRVNHHPNAVCPTCGLVQPEPLSVTCRCGAELACSRERKSKAQAVICPRCMATLFWQDGVLTANGKPVLDN